MKSADPQQYGADPVLGNYTDDAEAHLWCAQALANVLASPEQGYGDFNDDVQQALHYLLRCEVIRAQKAAIAQRRGEAERKVA